MNRGKKLKTYFILKNFIFCIIFPPEFEFTVVSKKFIVKLLKVFDVWGKKKFKNCKKKVLGTQFKGQSKLGKTFLIASL